MNSDRMKLNDGKTVLSIIGTKQQLKKVSMNTLSVGDSRIEPVTAARNLRIIFVDSMTVVPHINNICKSALFHLHNIRQIRKYLSVDTSRTLVHAFIIGSRNRLL